MFEPSEKETQDLNTGRLMRAEAEIILPMLDKQRDQAIARLCNYFRAGELEKLPVCVAQLVSFEDMKSEIKNKIAKAQNIERKLLDGSSRITDY